MANATSVKKDLKDNESFIFDPEEYKLRKRLPHHLPKRKQDIYISTKTNFAVLFKRCQKLFDAGETEIYLHGLGAAVTRTINMALQVQEKNFGALNISVNTSTIELIDDFLPLNDANDSHVKIRTNSAVHIRLYKTVPLS